MKDINLLPENRYNNGVIFRNLITIILLVVFMSLMIYFGIIEPLYNRRHAEQILRIHMAQMEKFENTQAMNIELKTQLEEVKMRKESMAALFEMRQPGSKIVSEIDEALPEGVLITSINYNDKTVMLQGRAPNQIEVADFSIGLGETGLFQSVRVLSIEKDISDGQHTFVVTLMIY